MLIAEFSAIELVDLIKDMATSVWIRGRGFSFKVLSDIKSRTSVLDYY